MPRGKKQTKIPNWAYYDNPKSRFGMIYADMLKSEQYQRLSVASRQLLTVIIVHSNTDIAKECLFNAYTQRKIELGQNADPHNVWTELRDINNNYFVFPKKQYEIYGYTKSYTSKYLKELKDNGFISVLQNGKTSRQVSIYKFDTKWKRPPKN